MENLTKKSEFEFNGINRTLEEIANIILENYVDEADWKRITARKYRCQSYLPLLKTVINETLNDFGKINDEQKRIIENCLIENLQNRFKDSIEIENIENIDINGEIDIAKKTFSKFKKSKINLENGNEYILITLRYDKIGYKPGEEIWVKDNIQFGCKTNSKIEAIKLISLRVVDLSDKIKKSLNEKNIDDVWNEFIELINEHNNNDTEFQKLLFENKKLIVNDKYNLNENVIKNDLRYFKKTYYNNEKKFCEKIYN